LIARTEPYLLQKYGIIVLEAVDVAELINRHFMAFDGGWRRRAWICRRV
jgi:hypothetical protein